MSNISEKAVAIFEQGHNCAQAVFAAFAEELGIDEELALKVASGFGGGIAQTRETCGAITGMIMAASVKFGYIHPNGREDKTAHNEKLQAMMKEFTDVYNSTNCGELLALGKKKGMDKPCNAYVELAAKIVEQKLKEY